MSLIEAKSVVFLIVNKKKKTTKLIREALQSTILLCQCLCAGLFENRIDL